LNRQDKPGEISVSKMRQAYEEEIIDRWQDEQMVYKA